jgi:sterol desaturase/sphingolipid hydroxylase (fatty acid hydroxylase superfamily)
MWDSLISFVNNTIEYTVPMLLPVQNLSGYLLPALLPVLLPMQDLVYGWLTFWVTYVTVGSLLPSEKAITRSKYIQDNISTKLIYNFIASGLVIPLVYQIPILYSFESYFWKYTWSIVIADIWFYHVHRLMHHPKFYKYHRDHHMYIQPHAMAALYCSMIEMIMLNLMSAAIPFQLFGYSRTELMIANAILALNGLKGHSGLQLYSGYDWLVNLGFTSEVHDIHHQRMIYNYGATYLIDYFYGTRKIE